MYMFLLLYMQPGQLMQKKFQVRWFSQISLSLGALSRTLHDKCTKIYFPMSQDNGLNHSYMQLLNCI